MSMLTKSIDRYVDELVAGDAEIVHAEAAEAFIRQHGDVIGFHVEDLVRRQITAAIKARSQVPAPPLGQGVMFTGLPAAITVRDGVTKPTRVCVREELAVGREMKVENITAARRALAAYDAEVDRLDPYMADPATTVEQAATALARKVAS